MREIALPSGRIRVQPHFDQERAHLISCIIERQCTAKKAIFCIASGRSHRQHGQQPIGQGHDTEVYIPR